MVKRCVFGRACCILGVGSMEGRLHHQPVGITGNPHVHRTVHVSIKPVHSFVKT